MMDIQIRNQVLNALYDAYRETPGLGERLINDLVEEFSVDKKVLEFNVEYLADTGFIRHTTLGGGIEIIEKGLKYVEGKSEFNPRPEFERQTIQISGGQVGDVIQAHNITINPSDFLHQMIQHIQDHPSIDSNQKKGWIKSLLEMANHSVVKDLIHQIFQTLKGS